MIVHIGDYTKQKEKRIIMHGNPQETFLAYLAGIVDGEGSIMITRTYSDKLSKKYRRKNNWYYPRIRVAMTDEEPIKMLQELCDYLGVKASRLLESAYPSRPNSRPCWRWQTTSREGIIKLLNVLRPYLVVKRPQCDVLIYFCENWKRPRAMKFGVDKDELQRREDAFQKMRKLNHVGVLAETECQGAERLSDSPAPLETLGEGNNKTLRHASGQ